MNHNRVKIPLKSNIKVPHGNILVNKKWMGSQVAGEFVTAACSQVSYSDSLGFVDFFPSDITPVIYVTEADLLTGMSYNERINLLSKEYQHKGIILADWISSSEAYKQLQSKCIDLELTLIPLTNQSEIPSILKSLSHVDSKLPPNPFKSSAHGVEKSLESEQIALLKSIPNVGNVCAVKLLKAYGHVKTIASLSEERLATKVGQPLAHTIYRYFRDKVHL